MGGGGGGGGKCRFTPTKKKGGGGGGSHAEGEGGRKSFGVFFSAEAILKGAKKSPDPRFSHLICSPPPPRRDMTSHLVENPCCMQDGEGDGRGMGKEQ